jgi:hypothetical protein
MDGVLACGTKLASGGSPTSCTGFASASGSVAAAGVAASATASAASIVVRDFTARWRSKTGASEACSSSLRRLRCRVMPLGGIARDRTLLIVALAVGLAVRLACLAVDPLIHPDGPAYLALASR